eukprot:TRINITY_DN22363_c0_g1_i2.p1 TRINITY_DN22363_c0_g1~~TRINITY_DN22363_c0_g1_i2.p1  ORF type:complete len:442 (-),score=81.13 TRINITY_DN22363_c0_g1_i2:164-1489(-)
MVFTCGTVCCLFFGHPHFRCAETGCLWGQWTWDDFVMDWSSAGFRYVGEWQYDDFDKTKLDTFIGAEGKYALVTINLVPTGAKEGLVQAVTLISERTLKLVGQQYEMLWFDTLEDKEPEDAVWELPKMCEGKMEEGKKAMEEAKKKAEEAKKTTASHLAKTLANNHLSKSKYSVQAIESPPVKKAPAGHHLSADIDMDLFRTMITYDPKTWKRRETNLPGYKLMGKYMRDVDKKIIGLELSLDPKERVPKSAMDRDLFLIAEKSMYDFKEGFCKINSTITFKTVQDQLSNLGYIGRVTMGTEQCEVWAGEMFRSPMINIYGAADQTEKLFYTAGWNQDKMGNVERFVDEWTFSNQDKAQPATNALFTIPNECSTEYKSKCHPNDVVACVEDIIKKELFSSNQCQILAKTYKCHRNGICKDTKDKVCTHIKNSGCGDCEEDD